MAPGVGVDVPVVALVGAWLWPVACARINRCHEQGNGDHRRRQQPKKSHHYTPQDARSAANLPRRFQTTSFQLDAC
jgi:hypothetical protein